MKQSELIEKIPMRYVEVENTPAELFSGAKKVNHMAIPVNDTFRDIFRILKSHTLGEIELLEIEGRMDKEFDLHPTLKNKAGWKVKVASR